MTNSLSEQRAHAGYKTPSWEQKQLIWSRVVSATAHIFEGGYIPNPTAERAHRADVRGVGLSGGWGAGKSLSGGMEGLAWLPYSDLIWIIADGYRVARPEFLYLAEGAMSSGLALEPEVNIASDIDKPCVLRSIPRGRAPDGSEIRCEVQTVTIRDYSKVAARRPDLIIVCEPGIIDDLHDLVELLWGRLAERRGLLWLGGTSDEASEEWYEIHEGWQKPNIEGGVAFSMPTWENKIVYPRGENETIFRNYRAKYGMDKYLAHFGGIPTPSKGLVLRDYWKPEVMAREDLEWNPALPTELCIDPNYSYGYYSVGVIQHDNTNGNLYLVDEVAEEGLTHDEIKKICSERPWWKNVQRAVMDPYAGNMKAFGNTPAAEYWWPLEVVLPDPRPKVDDTVQALKQSMSSERLYVSSKLQRWQWEIARWKLTKNGTPQTINCDMLKAVGYWLYDFFQRERLYNAVEEEDNIVRMEDFAWGGSKRAQTRRELKAGITRSLRNG